MNGHFTAQRGSSSTTLRGGERRVGCGVRGGDTLLGYEAARSPVVLRDIVGVWLVLPRHGYRLVFVVGVGLFFENCIVDASIL